MEWRCRAWYGMLLRLYPRPFQERFGEGMAQTFGDLCRERRAARRGLLGVAVGVYLETLAAIARERANHMTQMKQRVTRVALVALGLLMVPLVASRMVEGWNWGPGAFVFTYVLFFGTGMAYSLIAKQMGVWAYKAGVGLALVVGFVMGWSTMVMVSESENPWYLAYIGVLVVGGVGAWMVKLETRGLAKAMFVVAALLGVLEVVTARLWPAPPADHFRLVAFMHEWGLFVGLFAAAGWLFRRAGAEGGAARMAA